MYGILSRYIALGYLKSFGLITFIASCALYISTLFDTLNRFKTTNLRIGVILQLSLLKLPYLVLAIISLISLVSVLFFMHNMNKSRELSAIFSSGVSVLQILLPMSICGFILGVFVTCAVQPLSAALISAHGRLEAKISHKHSAINISNMGVIISEERGKERRVFRIQNIDFAKNKLSQITILCIDEQNKLTERIEAASGSLKDNMLSLRDGKVFKDEADIFGDSFVLYKLPTTISLHNIQNSYIDPECVSFWQLRSVINVLNEAGLPVTKHQVYYFSQLFKPLMIVATIMLGICLANTRQKRVDNIRVISFGVAVGFMLYICNEIAISIFVRHGVDPMTTILSMTLATMLVSFLVILYLHEAR